MKMKSDKSKIVVPVVIALSIIFIALIAGAVVMLLRMNSENNSTGIRDDEDEAEIVQQDEKQSDSDKDKDKDKDKDSDSDKDAEENDNNDEKSEASTELKNISGLPKTLKLEKNDTYTFAPKPVPADFEYDEVSYSSSDESVASVSDDGTLTAKSSGNAVITVSMDNVKRKVKITVTDKEGIVSEIQELMSVASAEVSKMSAVTNKDLSMLKERIERVSSFVESYKDVDLNNLNNQELYQLQIELSQDIMPELDAIKTEFDALEVVVVKCSYCGDTGHSQHPKCGICGNYDHTSDMHPKCGFCGNYYHTSAEHPRCNICGATDHAVHPAISADI